MKEWLEIEDERERVTPGKLLCTNLSYELCIYVSVYVYLE